MVHIRNVSKSFGPKIVLRDLSMTIPHGEFTVLMGPSGSGKTTLANLLLGLLRPDEGTIEGLEGTRFSAVFQDDRLCEQMSAIGNVRLVSRRLSPEDVRGDLFEVGLDEDAVRKPVSQLSGGQRRRVVIVRAMMADGEFVCLDEPFKGLDRRTRDRTMAYVENRIKGRTVLLITHDPAESARFGGNLRSL